MPQFRRHILSAITPWNDSFNRVYHKTHKSFVVSVDWWDPAQSIIQLFIEPVPFNFFEVLSQSNVLSGYRDGYPDLKESWVILAMWEICEVQSRSLG